MNTTATPQNATAPGPASPAGARRPRLGLEETDRLLVRQHELGVPVDVIAAVTRPSVQELKQAITDCGAATRPRGGHTPADVTLWNTDLAVLAGAVHGTRTTVAVGRAAHRRRRRSGKVGFKERLRLLVDQDHRRLLAHIDTLPPPERVPAVLRLIVVAVPHADTALVDALTDAALGALAQSAPSHTGAALLGWLAALHAAAGDRDLALHFSATQVGMLSDRPAYGEVIDPVAELHARWCRAALLALAGNHTEALRLHTDLPRVVAGTAAAVLSEDEERDEFDLIEARNHAAAGTRALHADLNEEAAARLATAADRYEHLLVHTDQHPLDDDMLGFELALVRFALGHARHRLAPGSGGLDWSACVRGLLDVDVPEHLEARLAERVLALARAAQQGQEIPLPEQPDRVPLPRLPLACVSPVLLADGVLWEMPLAPNLGGPDLPRLH
ncbi:hypothetical protein SUDANB95_07989 (plasmid) [Actinosynnema sp. ALI-1.44]